MQKAKKETILNRRQGDSVYVATLDTPLKLQYWLHVQSPFPSSLTLQSVQGLIYYIHSFI